MSLRGQYSRVRTQTETARFLVVAVGGTTIALHADAVEGLLTPEEAGSDGAPVLHGSAYPALDLVARLGAPADDEGPDTRVVLLSSGQARGSLRVAEVHGLDEFGRTDILPLPSQFRGEEREWYRGILLLDEEVALILNLAWLMPKSHAAAIERGAERLGNAPRLTDARQGLAAGRVSSC